VEVEVGPEEHLMVVEVDLIELKVVEAVVVAIHQQEGLEVAINQKFD